MATRELPIVSVASVALTAQGPRHLGAVPAGPQITLQPHWSSHANGDMEQGNQHLEPGPASPSTVGVGLEAGDIMRGPRFLPAEGVPAGRSLVGRGN